MKIDEVAKILDKSPQFVRIGLQRGLLPFGTAVKMPGSSRYTYHINERQFYKYIKGESENSDIEILIEKLGAITEELKEIKGLLLKATK
jgi:hypothetical protein